MSDFIKHDIQQPDSGEPIRAWLAKQLNEKRPFLLAFADDGVIWGRLADDGELLTSHEIDGSISPELRDKTLQQAFIFGADDEVRLFHDELGGWKALRVVDGDDSERIIEESQILWGSRAHKPKNGFTHIFDARQMGLDHIVPLEVENSQLDLDEGGEKCLRLAVHHLVTFDEITGEARIALSRLAGLKVGDRAEVVR